MKEYEECLIFTDYLRLKGLKFHHSPNETFTTSFNAKRKNLALGVSKGFPDYTILVPEGILYIEMKKKKGKRGGMNGSVISAEQTEWIQEINKRPGSEAHIAHGAEEAIQIVNKFL